MPSNHHRRPTVRPTIRSTVLATAVAAELAVGALLVAPPAHADDTPPAPGDASSAPLPEPPIRTGRTDDAPPAPTPVADPELPPAAVRTGRTGDVGEIPDAAPGADASAADPPPATPDPASDAATGEPSADRGSTRGSDDAPASSPPHEATPPAETPPGALTPSTPPLPTAHTVVEGDNLWEIAAAHLATASGRPRAELTALDIAPYWTRVCMTNRERLASGDVSLIYADEVIELPAP